MNISVSQEKGRVPVAVIHLEGKLDGQTYQALINEAREVFESGTWDILLDMEKLSYISSAGLVALHTVALLTRGRIHAGSRAGLGDAQIDGPQSGRRGSKAFQIAESPLRCGQCAGHGRLHRFLRSLHRQAKGHSGLLGCADRCSNDAGICCIVVIYDRASSGNAILAAAWPGPCDGNIPS